MLPSSLTFPFIGKQEIVVPPWCFGSQTAGVDRPAPLLGADTDDVLAELDRAATAATSAAAVEPALIAAP